MANIGPNYWYVRDNTTITNAIFTGSISGTVLTVTAVASGTLAPGQIISVTPISVTNLIISQASGITGGVGTYNVSASQTVASTQLASFSMPTIGTVGWSALSSWAASRAYTAGTVVRQSAATAFITGTISGTVLTVASVVSGTVVLGQTYQGPGITTFTISSFGTGTGGTGTYNISASQTVSTTTYMPGQLPFNNERAFACVVAGTSGTTEPAWVITKGAKTTDNTVTWQEITGQPGVCGDTTNSPTWTQNKNNAVTLGLIIYDSVTSSLQIVTTAGTTGNGSQPSFSATAGTTTSDNTVTWTSLGLASNFGQWKCSFARLATAFGSGWVTAGNIVYVAGDHTEVASTSTTVAVTGSGPGSTPTNIYCVNQSATFPLGSSNLATTASISNVGWAPAGGQFDIIYLTVSSAAKSSATLYGINLSGPAQIVIGNQGGFLKLSNCTISPTGTGSSASYYNNQITGGGYVLLENVVINFINSGQGITFNSGKLYWKGPGSATSGTSLTSLIYMNNNGPNILQFEGIDLTSLTAGASIFNNNNSNNRTQTVNLISCAISSGVTIAPSVNYSEVALISCDSSGTNYRHEKYNAQGSSVVSTGIVRTNGASNGTNSYSWQIVMPGTTSIFPLYFDSFPISIWNVRTGTNVTVTLYGIWNSTTVPTNDQIWIETSYLGSSGSPLVTINTITKANGLATGTSLPADSSSAWDSQVTARANSTAYTLGQVIKVADNPGRIFFCTTAGTSTTSEPAGYSTATDGTSVTDGSAVFRAGVRFALTTTLSSPQPQLVGDIYVTVKAAAASSTFYIDPLINLS